MAVKRIQAKSYFFAQYVEKKFWKKAGTMSDEDFKLFFGDLEKFGQLAEKRFTKNGHALKKIAVINHDRDTHSDGSAKPQHLHIFLEFEKKVDLNVVAKILGLENNFVIPTKKGRYGIENSLAYLIHAKQPEKHQYDVTEVWCNGSKKCGTFPETYDDGWYQKYAREHADDWARYSATHTKEKRQLSIDLVIEQILNFKIPSIDQMLLDNDLYALYADNRKRIDDAFKVANSKRALLFAQELDAGNVRKQTVFITGKAQLGKTTFLNKVIKNLITLHPKWRIYKAAGNNPWDGYSGQQIVIMDDFRVEKMQPEGWTHTLDPYYNMGELDARYGNNPPAYRLLFITNYLDPVKFFAYMPHHEDIDQFLGRLAFAIKVVTKDDINFGVSNVDIVNGKPEILNKLNSVKMLEKMNPSEKTGPLIEVQKYIRTSNDKVIEYDVGKGKITKNGKEKNKYVYKQDATFYPLPLSLTTNAEAVNIVSDLLEGRTNERRVLSDTIQKMNLLTTGQEAMNLLPMPVEDKKENDDDDELPFDLEE